MNQSLQIIPAPNIPNTQKVIQVLQAFRGKKTVACEGNISTFSINNGEITITAKENNPISPECVLKIEEYVAGIKSR